MSAIKLSLYHYRDFSVVFVSCKLSLVAQEVDLKVKLPFPIHTIPNCQRTSLRERDASLRMSCYTLVKKI